MKEQQVLLGTIQRLLKGGLKNSPCFYVNNRTARRFYYHTEHVHGGRREFHGDRVKKTTSSLETCVGEIANGNYKVLSPPSLITSFTWWVGWVTRGINRGYFVAAQRHEISLRVLKNISRVSPPFELFYDEFKVTKCCTKTFCLCWVLRCKIAFMRCVTFSNVLLVFGLIMNN